MARKQTALDREISRVQKNTRNKLYRLRAKGATNLDELDPRLSPANRKNMNGSQKKAYLRELQAFNERDNRIILQSNNVAVPAVQLAEYRIQEARTNVVKGMLRKNIEEHRPKAVRSELENDIDFNVFASTRLTKDKQEMYVPQTNRFHDIAPVVKQVPFSSAKALENAIKGAKKSEKIVSKNRKRYKSYKKGIAAKLAENGYDEIAEDMKKLTYAQMDWLHYYTDFDQEVNLFRYTRELDAGLTSVAEESLDMASEYIEELVAAARKIPRNTSYK